MLANSGCFVSKCVLWCFEKFCGVLRVFCDVLRVFCGVLRVFCSISTKHTKHPKNIEKHWKTRKTHNTLVYCGHFPRANNYDCIAQNTFFTKHLCKTPQNSAKHRKTQNSHKTRFVKLRRKTPQNKRKITLKTITKRSQYSRNTYCAHSVYSSKIRWICRESTQYAIYA